MKQTNSWLLCAIGVLITLSSYAQSRTLTKQQIERVVKVGQLWGHINYFHPYLPDPNVDWDAAFANEMEAILEADNAEAYGQAVQRMLAILNDPVTVVEQKPDTETSWEDDGKKYPIIERKENGILYVTVRDYADLADFAYSSNKFSSLRRMIPQSKGVIFDFRNENPNSNTQGYLSYYLGQLKNMLTASLLPLPGFTARMHDGFVPERGNSSGGYFSGTFTRGKEVLQPDKNAANVKMVFLVNEFSELNTLFLGLQNIGTAAIFSTIPLTDATFVERIDFDLGEGVNATFRTNKLPDDYQLGANKIIPEEADDEDIYKMAEKQLQSDNWTLPKVENDSGKKSSSPITMAEDSDYPPLGARLLAAAKIWTVIEYFFAYKELMDSDWEKVLYEYIPKFASAGNALEYHQAVHEMYANIQDGHGYIRSAPMQEFWGGASPPFIIRFIEEKPVIVALAPDSMLSMGKQKVTVGDVILEIDGVPHNEKIEQYKAYVPHSNHSYFLGSLSRRFLFGPENSTLNLIIQDATGKVREVSVERKKAYVTFARQWGGGRNDDPVLRLINDDIGYADLDRLQSDQVAEMFELFKYTKAIIFDMRGYPNGTAWSIAPHLSRKEPIYAANFRRYAPKSAQVNSREENITIFEQAIPPATPPFYEGKTVMLIDERTISQAEHTGLFFESVNGTEFIGSQTAGANGDVTNFSVPGNISLSFSGHDVRHIDGRQLQKIGLVPDVPVKPTVKGIRDGKDEVLEKAVSYLTEKIK